VDPDVTGAPQPLPPGPPGTPGREAHEREAALARGSSISVHPAPPLCAPDLPGLNAELLYTLVADNVRDYAIFLMDVNGIIRCWGESARLMKWWTREQAEGAHLRLLYPDGGAEDGTAEAHLINAKESGEYNGEGHRTRRDGSTFWAYVTLTALRSPDGTLAGFTKVTRDFSARRAVEAALHQERTAAVATRPSEHPDQTKRMVANLSHELRTPLNAILGSIALLSAGSAEGDPARPHIERLERNGRHLLAIVDDVLEMSRTESGQMAFEPAARRLGAVVQEALADIETLAGAGKVTIKNAVSGGPADLPYWGDEGRVRQILVNLLTNAIKFTDDGGLVTISGGTADRVSGAALEGDGPWVYARVEDTGRGIPPDRLHVVFEPFQQSAIEDQRRGTGLGLSISRQLARMMGGDLIADSEEGRGSRFTLWLPIAPSEPVPR